MQILKTYMNLNEIIIKNTGQDDFEAIMDVEKQAFGQDEEAGLTADLLKDKTAEPVLSLLAFHKNEAVGHILFTRVYIDEMSNQPLLHILAPLAVKPAYQKKGIGGLLIKEGLRRLKVMGCEMVFVLGHIEYYPKFGFIPDANIIGYSTPFPIPEEVADAWMVQSLNPEGFPDKKGKIICADELNKPEYWRE